MMPLTNPVIIKLNEITTFVQDKSKLTENEVVEIKKIFPSFFSLKNFFNLRTAGFNLC